MKFRAKMTREIINESVCEDVRRCAFVTLYNQIVPSVIVAGEIEFHNKEGAQICVIPGTHVQWLFISRFDSSKTQDLKDAIPEQWFDLEIPDSVIDYWYKGASEAAQIIANSEILEPIGDNIDQKVKELI